MAEETTGFAPLVGTAYVVALRPDMDVFDPTRLIRRYGHSFCDSIGCQRNDASVSSAGVHGQAGRSGNREATLEKERLAAKCAKRFLIDLLAVDHAMSLTPRLVQRIGPELHAVRCFSVELQACSASANVVKGEPAILIAL